MNKLEFELFFGHLAKSAGDDPRREGLIETPERLRKAWGFFLSGYRQDPMQVLKSFADGGESYDELVFQGSIPFYSQCEHHLVPFFGYVHVGYIPSGKIVGLSKFARIVDIFARRLQVQERLTNQIVDLLMDGLQPRGAGCVVQARHMCMESRGVCKTGTITITSALRGNFKERPEVRSEFMDFVKTAMAGVRTL